MASQNLLDTAAYDEEGARLKKRSGSLQKHLIRVRIVFRVLDLATSIVSIVSVGNGIFQYYSTLTASNGGMTPWPAAINTALYPSLITFGAGLIALILASIVLISYAWGTAKADAWEDSRELFEKCATALKITTSSAAAGSMFSTGNSTNPDSQSLWNYSCNTVTNEVTELFQQFIDFGSLCNQQQLAAAMHLIQVVSEVLTVITYILSYFAGKNQKALDEHDAAPPPGRAATAASTKDTQYQKTETTTQEM